MGHTRNNRRFAQYWTRIIVENAEVRNWLLQNGETEGRIALIPSGIEIKERPLIREREAFRASLGLDESRFVIGYCGRWSPEKNPLGFIEIAARLSEQHPDYSFVMTGAGQLSGEISNKLSQISALNGRFHLLGNVPDLAPVLSGLDVLLLPSLIDGRPVVVLEALAAGVPVVASNIGGLPALIHTGLNGILCQVGHVNEFVDAVRSICEDRQKMEGYKQAARQFAEEHLDSRKMIRNYADILSK
jgi:glycosyltransferase involved in cell wall biosynthesis